MQSDNKKEFIPIEKLEIRGITIRGLILIVTVTAPLFWVAKQGINGMNDKIDSAISKINDATYKGEIVKIEQRFVDSLQNNRIRNVEVDIDRMKTTVKRK